MVQLRLSISSLQYNRHVLNEVHNIRNFASKPRGAPQADLSGVQSVIIVEIPGSDGIAQKNERVQGYHLRLVSIMAGTKRSAVEAPDSTRAEPKRARADKEEDEQDSVTIATPSSTSANKVFAIAELLENVLVHLPERSIFQVQRVSHAFKSGTESTKIKRALFLLPEPSTTPRYRWTFDFDRKTITEDAGEALGVRQTLAQDAVEQYQARRRRGMPEVFSAMPVKLNDLLVGSLLSSFGEQWGGKPYAHSIVDRSRSGFTTMSLALPAFTGEAQQRASNALRSMLISRPPATLATMKWRVRGRPTRDAAMVTLQSDTGITYGQILDSLVHARREINILMKMAVEVSVEQSILFLHDVIVPTDSEWEMMGQGKAFFGRGDESPTLVTDLNEVGGRGRTVWTVQLEDPAVERERQLAAQEQLRRVRRGAVPACKSRCAPGTSELR
ncbi:hypothetical protein LTR65_008292 [Meristemomyces frigidus]